MQPQTLLYVKILHIFVVGKPVKTVDNADIVASVEREVVRAYLDHPVVPDMTPEEVAAVRHNIMRLLREQDAVLVAHYYTAPVVQALAEETGGCVADSLEMARFGRDHQAKPSLSLVSVSWAKLPRF